MAGQTDMELIKNGVRLDGRKPDELRDVKIVAGVLDNADGSCYLEWGNNKVYAGVLDLWNVTLGINRKQIEQ